MNTGLIKIIKRASLEALESNQPCDIRYGTVVSTDPLKVKITPQFILPSALLVVPQHLTDYEVEMDIEIDSIKQKRTVTIHNSLKNNDKVALLRQYKGQSYFILDRI